jgi:hypothetical protein
VVSPVLEEPRGFGSYLPLAGGEGAPRIDVAADLVDDRRQVVGLLLRRQAAALVEDQLLLFRAASSLLRLGDGGDELGAAPPVDQVPGRLARLVELPVLAGVLVGGVDDRAFEERVRHARFVDEYCRLGRENGF